ncbi:MAG TPA: hypothetical protein VMG08_04985 [Allosphingosinicella sp.]|nr:hypothetical protein [Allosphingosinicella sp.]
MSNFEFIFSLFALLLGFSLAEVLGGLAKATKLRRKVRIGWLTPLLAAFVLLDILSFWSGIWQARELIPMTYATLVFGLAVTGLYYLAAAIIFPDDPEEFRDFDDYYFAHRRQVLTAVWLCNSTAFPAMYVLAGRPPHAMTLAMIGLYTVLVAAAVFSARKWLNAAALGGLIAIYALEVILSALSARGS